MTSDRPTSHILVVDDDADIREALADVLAAEGYTVATAANGRRALEVLRTGARPSIILLDLMMPVMDGYQFRAAQLADPAFADIPVVVITAGGHDPDGRTIDACDRVQKPLHAEALLETIERFRR